MVFEFLGSGPRMSYLSQAYVKEHGSVFWVQMNCTPDQQEIIIAEAADMETLDIDYDFGSTWFCSIIPHIRYDIQRFNCSESGEHLWLKAKRVGPEPVFSKL